MAVNGSTLTDVAYIIKNTFTREAPINLAARNHPFFQDVAVFFIDGGYLQLMDRVAFFFFDGHHLGINIFKTVGIYTEIEG